MDSLFGNNKDLDNNSISTFRIESEIKKKLREESDSRGITLNAFVNWILKRYIEWDSFEQKVGLVAFPRSVLNKMFAGMSKEEITTLAAGVGKNAVIDMSFFMNGQVDVDEFLSWLDVRMKNSGLEVNHRVNEVSNTMIIKHDLGENWSLYYQVVLESIFSEIFKKRIDFLVKDSSILSFKCDR